MCRYGLPKALFFFGRESNPVSPLKCTSSSKDVPVSDYVVQNDIQYAVDGTSKSSQQDQWLLPLLIAVASQGIFALHLCCFKRLFRSRAFIVSLRPTFLSQNIWMQCLITVFLYFVHNPGWNCDDPLKIRLFKSQEHVAKCSCSLGVFTQSI